MGSGISRYKSKKKKTADECGSSVDDTMVCYEVLTPLVVDDWALDEIKTRSSAIDICTLWPLKS